MSQLKDYLLGFGIFSENDYLEKYVDLIELNRDRRKEKYKTKLNNLDSKKNIKSLFIIKTFSLKFYKIFKLTCSMKNQIFDDFQNLILIKITIKMTNLSL